MWSETVELNGAGRVLAHIDLKDLNSPYSGILALPQNRTERILARHLTGEGVNIERGVLLAGFQENEATVQSALEHNDGSIETVRTSWLVGCDGANSTVRQLIGSRFESVSSPSRYILADLKIRWPLPLTQFTAFFHPEGPVYIAPCLEGRQRLILDVTNQPLISGEDLSFDYLRLLFSRRVSVSAQLSDASWIFSYESTPGYVSSYRAGRVLLAGDSAHVHPQAGAAGMNAGIQDAFNLAWKLPAPSAQSSEQVLDTYSAERRHIAQALLALQRGITEAAGSRNPPAQHLKNLALPLLSGWDAVPHSSVMTIPEMGLNYRNSTIVERSGRMGPGAPQAGDRAPLPSFGGRNLIEWLDPSLHTLMLFTAGNDAPEHISSISAIRRDFDAAYPNQIRGYVVTRTLGLSGKDLLSDVNGTVHSAFGADTPCMYLIRPDAYIAYQSEPPDGAALHRFLRDAYGMTPSHYRSYGSGNH